MVVPIGAAITQAPARTAELTHRETGESGEAALRVENANEAGGPDLPSRRPIDAAGIAEAAARLQQIVREASRNLEFRVDDYSGRTVITVRNEATGEVVRQIPAEEVLALARSIGNAGTIVDSKA